MSKMENPQEKVTELEKVNSKNKITKEMAEKEFIDFLHNTRRVSQDILEQRAPDVVEAIDNCIEKIMRGVFRIVKNEGDPNKTVVIHKLAWPIGEEFDEPITELTYKARLLAKSYDVSRKYRNPDDDTKVRLTASALSGVSMSLIGKMEEADLVNFGDLSFFYFLV